MHSILRLHKLQTKWVIRYEATKEKVSIHDMSMEQWVNIKFCANIGNSDGEVTALLTMVQDECTMMKQCFWMAQAVQGKARRCAHSCKPCLCVSLITRGYSSLQILAKGQTVNQQYYLWVLIRLWKPVHRKEPDLWHDKWILRHDNAPAHDTLRTCKFQAKKSITKMDNPPYSPATFDYLQN
jgi:hypothetical protein